MKKLLPMNHDDTTSFVLAKVGIWLIALMAPLYDILGAVMLLIVIDFLTGLGAAYKLRESVSAAKMRNTVNKFLFYTLTIIAAHLVEVKITPALPWLNIISGFIALTELRSIFDNFNRIFGINIFNYIKTVISRNSKAGRELLESIEHKEQDKKDEK